MGGLESIALLLAHKVQNPENIFLLRGNHDDAALTRIYGFYDECKRLMNVKLWKEFCSVFRCLPVCAIVDSKIFCIHGGLSPELESLDQIRAIERPVDGGDQGLLCDLLWSDPDPRITGWAESERGCGHRFGTNVIVNV